MPPTDTDAGNHPPPPDPKPLAAIDAGDHPPPPDPA